MGKTIGPIKKKAKDRPTPQERAADAIKEGADNTVKRHNNDLFLTEVCKFTPAQMFVDLDYQRDPAKRMVMHKKIVAEGFQLNRAEPLHVHVRKNKEVVVLDGGGRWFIMMHLLNMKDTEVKCLNHPFIKSLDDEIKVYCDLNTQNRMKINEKQRHKAKLMLGDKEAVDMDREANEGGLTILGDGYNRIQYASAQTLHHWGILRRTGEIKMAAWPKIKIDSWVFTALGAILKACPAIKERLLIDVLIDNPPNVLKGKLKEIIGFGKPHARNMPPKMAQVIMEFYNKRKSANRIIPDWKRVDRLCIEKPYSDRWGWFIANEDMRAAE